MTTNLIPIITLALLAGCSGKSDAVGPEPLPPTPVPVSIDLRAGVSVVTKGPVEEGSSVTVSVEGWESSGDVSYAGGSTWRSSASVSAHSSASSITLVPEQYYSSDDATRTYIQAWYPAEPSDGGSVSFKRGSQGYSGDGTDDVLLSTAVFGTKSSPVSVPLQFDHMTTRLSFRVKKGEGLAEGTRIEKIELQGSEIPTGIDLSRHAVIFSASDLDAGVTPSEIPDTSTAAGVSLMVRPTSDNTTLTLHIETWDPEESGRAVYEGVSIAPDSGEGFAVGKSYVIDLTFQQTGVSVEASIEPWPTPIDNTVPVQ